MTNLTRRSKTTLIFSATILGLSASSLALAHPQSITPSRVSQAKAAEASKSYNQATRVTLHAVRVVARFKADGLVPKLDMDAAMPDIPAGSSVAISLRGAPLRFDQLTQKRQVDLEKRFGKDASARYEAGLSSQLAELVAKVRSDSPADRVGVVGMPFVPFDSDDTASNSNYTQLIGEVDVFIPRSEAGQKPQLLNALSALARGRDIVSVDGDLLDREGRDQRVRDSRQERDNDRGVRPSGSDGRRGSGRRTVSVRDGDSDTGNANTAGGSEEQIARLRSMDSQDAMSSLIAAWGSDNPNWDFNNDGLVDGQDLAFVLGYYADGNDGGGDDGDDGDNGDNGDNGNDDGGDDGGNGGGSGEGIQELVPGSGFTGLTAQPARMGNASMSGYPAQAIARWTEFPYITRSRDFYVTISAYHMADIDRVEFSLNGGDPVVCTDVQPHPETGYAEYITRVDVSDLLPGKHEIRATIYPKVGKPRVLQGETPRGSSIHTINNGNESFWFNYDPNPTTVFVGPDSQYETINDAIDALGSQLYGGRIYLTAGTHVLLSRDNQGFRNTDEDMVLTISAAPGLQASDVNLLGYLPSSGRAGRLTHGSLHIRNITVLSAPTDGYASAFHGRGANRLFVEGVYNTSTDPIMGWGDLSVQRLVDAVGTWTLGCWTKDCTFVNVPKGINGLMLAKNNTFTRLSADAFGGGPGAVINCSLDMSDHGNAQHGQHCDIVQVSITDETIPVVENRIYADIRSTNSSAQCGHLSSRVNVPYKNFAFVRWEVDSMYGSSSLNIYNGLDHLVVDDCIFRNSSLSLISGQKVKRFLIRNTVMRKIAANGANYDEVFEGAGRDIVFDGLRLHDTRNAPFIVDGMTLGSVRFAAPSAPVGESSNGSGGFIPTYVMVEGQISNQYLGNPNVLKQGTIRDHFYYDKEDLDLSWTVED